MSSNDNVISLEIFNVIIRESNLSENQKIML